MSHILQLLSEDAQLITYRPSLLPIGKTVTGTILLSQIIYWNQKALLKGQTEFYKFQCPCQHEKYKKGDSWVEELGFSKDIFRNALKQIGYKTTKKENQKIQELIQKPNLSKNEKNKLKKYNNAIIYYRTDPTNLTWYSINTKRLINEIKAGYTDSTRSGQTQPPGKDKPNLPYNTETTTETTIHTFSNEKAKDFVSASPPLNQKNGGIIRDSKKPCNIKKTGRKNKKRKTKIQNNPPQKSNSVINTKTQSYYNQLKTAGATKHNETKKAYFDTMDTLYELLYNKSTPPYSMCSDAEHFINYTWTIDELIKIFKFQLKNADKFNRQQVKSIGRFIILKGFKGGKTWSPLLYWHQKMNKTNSDDLDKHGSKLYKSFKRAKIKAHDTENPVLNKLGQQIEILEKYYEFYDDGDELSYPFGIVDYFTKVYVKEKLNDNRFKIYHINKKTFVREFVQTALQRNFMKKKSKWIDINLDNVELGQKPSFNA